MAARRRRVIMLPRCYPVKFGRREARLAKTRTTAPRPPGRHARSRHRAQARHVDLERSIAVRARLHSRANGWAAQRSARGRRARPSRACSHSGSERIGQMAAEPAAEAERGGSGERQHPSASAGAAHARDAGAEHEGRRGRIRRGMHDPDATHRGITVLGIGPIGPTPRRRRRAPCSSPLADPGAPVRSSPGVQPPSGMPGRLRATGIGDTALRLDHTYVRNLRGQARTVRRVRRAGIRGEKVCQVARAAVRLTIPSTYG